MAKRKGAKSPDPLGKRALYWIPPAPPVESDGPTEPPSAVVLPVGKRALYSGARPGDDDGHTTTENPLAERGVFAVRCQRCQRLSRIGLLDLLIFQFPIGVWIPRGQFDRRMTCPSCRKRAWCSVTLRRD